MHSSEITAILPRENQTSKGQEINIKAEFVSHFDAKFKVIRDLDDITDEDLRRSLNIAFNRKRAFKAGQGAGKSGSFFFFSFDDRFVIKTIIQVEKDLLIKMLDSLTKHFITNNN